MPTQAVLSVSLLRGAQVGTAHRTVPRAPAVATAAVQQLLRGPDATETAAGLTTAIPTGTTLRSVVLRAGVATVDLSRNFGTAATAIVMAERLAQVVFTLTQFPSVTGVAFALDGQATATFGGSFMLAQPATRASFTEQTPPILVESPAPSDAVTSPLTVTGIANTYEGATSFRLLDASGATLGEARGTGGAMGQWAPFEAQVRFPIPMSSTGTLIAFTYSPKDGSMVDEVSIPVRLLAPGQGSRTA